MAGPSRFRSVVLAVALATALAACTSGGSDTSTSTTAAPTSTTTATPDDPNVDEDVITGLRDEIAALVETAEDLRGLEFIDEPDVTILGPEALAARVREDLEEELVSEELAIDTRVYRMLGILDAGDDLEQMYLDLYSEQVLGFYDGDTGELVVGGEAGELGPADRSTVVHELVHALGDQHFDFSDALDELVEGDRFDEAGALQALVEGDATYFQLVYIQELSPADQLALATEALAADTTVLSSVPDWMMSSLLFPYEAGQTFVGQLIDSGGIAALDQAYGESPISTEQILHPERYQAGETIRQVPSLGLAVDGYTTHEESTFGELSLRLLLTDTVTPGLLTQAADGWGGDAYQVLFDEDDVAFALAYRGDVEEDATELTSGLIEHAKTVMGAGEGIETGGGLLFDNGGLYVFIRQIGDGLIFIAATDSSLGTAIRSQMIVP